MLISKVNGRDKVEICEREEIKSSSSIKAVDKKVFSWHVCAGKTLCQEPSSSEGEGILGTKCKKKNGIINIGEDSKTLGEGQHLLKASHPNEDLGRRLKHTPSPTGGGERDKISKVEREISRERSTTQGSYRLRRGGRY